MIESIEQLQRVIESHEQIVLYGGGEVCQAIILYMEKHGWLDKVDTVVDSYKEGKLLGFPVVKLSELQCKGKEQFFLVTVVEKWQAGIKGALEQEGYTGFELLSNELCQILTGRTNRNGKGIYRNKHEMTLLRENGWKAFSFDEAMFSKYRKLIAGLDENSIDLIARILNRIKRILDEEREAYDFYTEEEKESIQKCKEQFHDVIMRFPSAEVFSYRNYFLPINHFESSVFVYKHGFKEIVCPEGLKGKTFIDAGAFVGDSVLVMEELCPGRIICFEAVESHCTLIRKTLELNDISNVTVEQTALGEAKGTIEFQVLSSSSNGVGRKGLEYTDIVKVPLVSLDDYVEEHSVSDIGLIKSDIEGMEQFLLKGARKTIEKYRPVLLISMYHNPSDFFEIKPMIDSWNLGYKFSVYKPLGNNTVVAETLLIAQV